MHKAACTGMHMTTLETTRSRRGADDRRHSLAEGLRLPRPVTRWPTPAPTVMGCLCQSELKAASLAWAASASPALSLPPVALKTALRMGLAPWVPSSWAVECLRSRARGEMALGRVKEGVTKGQDIVAPASRPYSQHGPRPLSAADASTRMREQPMWPRSQLRCSGAWPRRLGTSRSSRPR